MVIPASRKTGLRRRPRNSGAVNIEEYSGYDAIGLAELVDQQDVLPSELAKLALAAIEQLNPEINAVIAELPVDLETLDDNLPDGPFRGVPFLIKDLILHAAGIPVDMGSRLTAGRYIMPHDTDLMTRYREAGLVTLGRTNTPEMGISISTEPLLYGPTRNPWDVNKTAGGSSGGAAAAVAARILPMAHASDGGGSIRIPASCCGLVGMKPTRGRTPVGPDVDEGVHGFGIEHAVSRTVRDSAALLDATEGPGMGDSFEIPRPAKPYLEEVATPPGKLKIAFTSVAWSGAEVDAECALAVEESAKLCESLGHTVVEAAPPVDGEAFNFTSLRIWCAITAAGIEYYSKVVERAPSEENLEATTWAVYQYGKNMTAIDLENAFAVRNQVARTVAPFFREFDVFLTPTLPAPPMDLGVLNANDPELDAEGWLEHVFSYAAFNPLFNLTGQPAVSLPLYQRKSGLPIGSQFVGRFGDEATLFRLAGQLEEARPWIDRKPPLSI